MDERSVMVLRRFCREHDFAWLGVVGGDDLMVALRRGCGGVWAELATGRIVRIDAVVVPSYVTLKRMPASTGTALLTQFAREGVAVLSATDDLTGEEVAWLTTPGEGRLRRAA